MLCLKAVALANEMYSSHGVMLPANLKSKKEKKRNLRSVSFDGELWVSATRGRSLQKVMHKVGKNRSEEPQCRRSRSDPSSCSSGDGTPSCSGLDASKSYDGTMEGRRHKMCNYRSQLEEEVEAVGRYSSR
ncbi:uncharacterized protein LOC121969814 isoform X1 [Zingiber officinale]|uniref:uncharacterized protein LOC121969814 isoform X1 n=1 Tax=Zingiber officinale TaxID=94328 RepID=UPI001C4AC0D1|nr:uncharacterized protein LOC121969814 isoform X1 [Zingiber officinale]XP_042376015.1 uncharacterized protein LOC121969814 isoform X1 [Zingiber officinale]